MGIIESTNKAVRDLEGLHLYHYGASNCAMRVRITLEEKGLEWTSHHLDLLKKEHLTAEYFSINPNGLVPTLVHDGVVIIESNDIIDYLDKTFPDPPLRPADTVQLTQMYEWMERAASIHVKAVKTHIYEKTVRGRMAQSPEEEKAYRQLQTNAEVLEFHRKSSANEFSQEELDEARRILDECFRDANQVLSQQDWLAGNELSLADISWMPLHFTLKNMAGFDFSPYPNVRDWSERMSRRDSYRRAIVDWFPKDMPRPRGEAA